MSGKRSASGRGKVRLDRRTGKKQRDERKTPNETSGSDSSDSDDSSLAGIGKQEMRKRLREMEKQLQSAKTLCQMQHENTNFVSMVTPTANRVRRLDESERGERNFNLQKKGYKKQIKDYIKDKWYDEMKFIEHSQIPVRMVEEMIVEKWLTVPNGLTTRGFIEKCEPLVVSSLKGIRQSSQQLMRQRWIADYHKGRVPMDFPENVAPRLNAGSCVLLPAEYRLNADDKAFKYLVERMITANSPSKCRFERKKGQVLISDIFTVQDEAFALLVIYNECENWYTQEKKREEGQSGRKIRMKKRFTDADSGSHDGWSRAGRKVYRRLVSEVTERRKQSVDVEKMIMQEYLKECRRKAKHGSGYDSNDVSTSSDDEDDLDCLTEKQKLLLCKTRMADEDLDKMVVQQQNNY